MSISVIFSGPRNADERTYNLPVLTEDLFRTAVLPAATNVGAEFVPLFGTGFELARSDGDQVRAELLRVLDQLQGPADRIDHVASRLRKLSSEIDRIFNTRPDALLYIG